MKSGSCTWYDALSALETNPSGATLIVVPSTLLGQWAAEIRKSVPSPSVLSLFVLSDKSQVAGKADPSSDDAMSKAAGWPTLDMQDIDRGVFHHSNLRTNERSSRRRLHMCSHDVVLTTYSMLKRARQALLFPLAPCCG